eukprot:586031-Rhodomonas_salina.1
MSTCRTLRVYLAPTVCTATATERAPRTEHCKAGERESGREGRGRERRGREPSGRRGTREGREGEGENNREEKRRKRHTRKSVAGPGSNRTQSDLIGAEERREHLGHHRGLVFALVVRGPVRADHRQLADVPLRDLAPWGVCVSVDTREGKDAR